MGNFIKSKNRISRTKSSTWSVVIRQDEDPHIGRIVLADAWYPCPEDHPRAIRTISADARSVLEEVCLRFPKPIRVQYLMTCGGFIHFPWPDIPTDFDFTNPPKDVIEILVSQAQAACEKVLTGNLKARLSKLTRFICMGVDGCRDGLYSDRGPHIELVGLLDLQNNTYHWTGKSYPTTHQQKTLVRMSHNSHFFTFEDEKVMVLGCHDMNLFSPRSKAVAGKERQQILAAFNRLVKRERPSTVLQHPHTTDTYRVWLLPYSALIKSFPSIRNFASAGRYENRGGGIPRAEKEGGCRVVLEKLKLGPTVDLILSRE